VDQLARVPEELDEDSVGLLDVQSGDIGHIVGEVPLGVHRVDQRGDPRSF
jgi:hypothetical protein